MEEYDGPVILASNLRRNVDIRPGQAQKKICCGLSGRNRLGENVCQVSLRFVPSLQGTGAGRVTVNPFFKEAPIAPNKPIAYGRTERFSRPGAGQAFSISITLAGRSGILRIGFPVASKTADAMAEAASAFAASEPWPY
jgi:hypothetical protein